MANQCFICYDKTSLLNLECNHKLCFSCSKKWLLKNASCPFCRQPSFFFDRSTRSQKYADDILHLFLSTMNDLLHAPNNISIDQYFLLLNQLILKNKHLWYRPIMNHFLSIFLKKDFFQNILNDDHNFYSSKTKQICKDLFKLSFSDE